MSNSTSVDEGIDAIKHEYLAHAGKRPSRVVSMIHALVTGSDEPQAVLDRVVSDVLSCEIAHRSPPPPAYQARVVKELFSKIPEEDLTESLYELYSEALQYQPNEEGDFGYTSYELDIPGSDMPVHWVCSIKQRSTALSDIGRTMWDAGILLADVLSSASKLIQGRICLELGAGTGFTSIVAAASGAHMVLATDRNEEIVGNARDNAVHNGLGDRVPCMVLDWSDQSDDLFERIAEKLNVSADPSSPARYHHQTGADLSSQLPLHYQLREIPRLDVILAADVIYTPDLARLFVSMLFKLLEHWPHLFSLVAITERVPETVSIFQQALQERGMAYNRLTPEEVVGRPRKRWAHFDVENRDLIYIYEIELESAKKERAQMLREALHKHIKTDQ